MAERLWCIAQLGTAERDLFRQHPQVVAEVGDSFEHRGCGRQVRLAVFSRADQCLDQPESAHHECALAAANACDAERKVS